MSSHAEIVAWICFGIGAVFVLVGAGIGVRLSWLISSQPSPVTAKGVGAKVEEAKENVEQLKTSAVNAAAADPNSDAASKATSAAQQEGAKASGVLNEVAGIISALPERLRYAGFLVLIGALLMSVATVQFGGHPIF